VQGRPRRSSERRLGARRFLKGKSRNLDAGAELSNPRSMSISFLLIENEDALALLKVAEPVV
jgi:hypothetical protein